MIKEHDFKLHFGAGIASFKDLSENTNIPSAQSGAEVEANENTDMDMSTDDEVDTTIIESNVNNTPSEQPQPHNMAQPSAGANNQMEVDNTDDVSATQHLTSADTHTSTEQIIAHNTNVHSAESTASEVNAHQSTDGADELADTKAQ